MSKQVKEEASILYSKAEFGLAYAKLWELGCNGFLSYLLNSSEKKDKWLLHQNAGNYFWNEFIISDSIIKEIVVDQNAEDLFHTYFNKSNFISEKLIKKISQHGPDLIIKLIRLNKLFLNPSIYPTLISLNFSEKHSSHILFWKQAKEKSDYLCDTIQELAKDLKGQNIYQILSDLIIWIEENRFNLPNSKHVLNHLGRVYSFFIEKFLIHHIHGLTNTIDENKFHVIFMNRLDNQSESSKQKINYLLNVISKWIELNEDVLVPYCFNLNENPVCENETIYLQSSPGSYYKWRLDGIRYDLNQFRYHMIGSNIVEELERSGRMIIPKGQMPDDEDINRTLVERKYGTIQLMEDLCIENLSFNAKDYHIANILGPLLTFSTNRLLRYEKRLIVHSSKVKTYREAFRLQAQEAVINDIRVEPFLYMDEKEYSQLNKRGSYTSDEITAFLLKIFSFEGNQAKETTLYKTHYDVFQKPFLKIGSYVFCPMIFFATNQWFYSYIQEALMLRKGSNYYRAETTKMEQKFGEIFQLKRWTVKVINDKEAAKIHGDVDLIISDNVNTLFIQLKRTFLRLNAEDTYNEYLMVDWGGRKQLNDAEKFLSNENEIFKITTPVTKWLVTTSFEAVNEVEHDCRKVNYFELLSVLNNPEVKSIADLIKDISNDKSIKDFQTILNEEQLPIEMKAILNELGLPLPIFELKNYKKTIFTTNENVSKEYAEIFNNAINFDNEGKKAEAIRELNKCCLLDPKDAEAWSALGNVYCDIKDYTNSFICFEKALTLAPDDPMMLQNYSVGLIESGKYYDGLKSYMQLYRLYPMLGNIKFEIETNLKSFIYRHLLTLNEAMELANEWKNMS